MTALSSALSPRIQQSDSNDGWSALAQRTSHEFSSVLTKYGWDMHQALNFSSAANLIEKPHMSADGRVGTHLGLIAELGVTAERGELIIASFVEKGLLNAPTAPHLPYTLSRQGREVQGVLAAAAGMIP